MRKRSVLLLAAVLFVLPLKALAQHSSKAAETNHFDPKLSRKAFLIAGQISLDGKDLVTENNEIWAISNPDVLAGYEGKQVHVKCQRFADKNEIRVLSIEPGVHEVKSAVNYGDSAFRR